MFHRLLVEKDVPIQLRDGGTVVSDVFRPVEAGRFPVIITLGPYPKDIPFSRWQPAALFQHDDPRDRVPRSKCTIHTGGAFDSHLLLPIIPA